MRTEAARGQPCISVEIVGLQGFLEPVELVLLDAAEQLERTLDRVGAAAVEHASAVRAELLTRRMHERLVVREVATERPPAELQGAVPRTRRRPRRSAGPRPASPA